MESEERLKENVAIITGASAGIGRATARELAGRGADVVLMARGEDRLQDVADSIESETGARAVAAPGDATDRDDVEAAVGAAVDEFGSLDVAISNVGRSSGGTIDRTSVEDFEVMQATNARSSFLTTTAALPHLRESGGNLIFVSSYAAEYPYPQNPVYAGTKSWIRGFALSLFASEGERGVGVTVVHPSEVRTQVWADKYDEGEITEPEEVAETIAFAAELESSAVPELSLYRRNKLSFF
ncbi:SDR family oxidoreductase [Natrarchaeobius chitinivorans]|uniref:SDR family oxidoreductase n=1 Tax=Natrarchaeobius chitinivorans TaxID=1679083 RepID=A0A3N6LXD3_NATCH|nr:SDR family oxidoreductase [Natrarchaeobius chitinivorans]RQG95428.1 SDR family oxidoreductase [Natrarchaeobius chitinivorans]